MALQTAGWIRKNDILGDPALIRNQEYLGNNPEYIGNRKNARLREEWFLNTLVEAITRQ